MNSHRRHVHERSEEFSSREHLTEHARRVLRVLGQQHSLKIFFVIFIFAVFILRTIPIDVS